MGSKQFSYFFKLWLVVLTIFLNGCSNMLLMDPKGQIGLEQRSLIITATLLMLIVVIPVIIMTITFSWQYRASNKKARYAPDWSHSTRIEAVVWAVPFIIIIILGTITWQSSHQLDPTRPIENNEKKSLLKLFQWIGSGCLSIPIMVLRPSMKFLSL